MLVKYYKNPLLAYANRKRYKNIPSNILPLAQEEQMSIKLGDGAETEITTSVNNLCDYVKIDDTRWYVVAYSYQNGGQITMRLKRDVVGEFGLIDCFGKIERGYTETFLRNRKELSLNQRLIDRIPVIPNTFKYGNYTVNNHNYEKWGVLYIAKPTTAEHGKNINIPEFAPSNYNEGLPYIPDGTYKRYDASGNPYVRFYMLEELTQRVYSCNINFVYNKVLQSYSFTKVVVDAGRFNLDNFIHRTCIASFKFSSNNITSNDKITEVETYLNAIGEHIIYNLTHNTPAQSYALAQPVNIEITQENAQAYRDYTIKDTTTNKYYNYSLSNIQSYSYGNLDDTVGEGSNFSNQLIIPLNGTQIPLSLESGVTTLTLQSQTLPLVESRIHGSTQLTSYNYRFNATEISNQNSGTMRVNFTTNFVDEPYVIYIVPLYDVVITKDSDTYTVVRDNAQRVFNNIIQALSGENGYLVDAQIYPYCPDLMLVSKSDENDEENIIGGVPVFEIMTTSFERDCLLELKPYCDVKKEYIKRQYSIMAPDQSSKFTFNFYDYTNRITEGQDGFNTEKIPVKIKTALKPFNIISSLVIIPDEDSLIGKTYNSDLRGCKPSGSGFECSLSTNQYQQYLRNNSNYKEFFRLEREELDKSLEVERVNESVSRIVNTLTATAMGAIGGAAISDYEILGNNMKGVGAAIGAGIAGTTVGIAMNEQYSINQGLRDYERKLLSDRQDLTIGTIKNLPNQVSRVSTFNELIMRDFYFVVEVYECSEQESALVDIFIENYSYGIGVYGLYTSFLKNNWFIRGTLIKSNYVPILHNLLSNELEGGIYYNE